MKAEHQPHCLVHLDQLDVNIGSSLCFQDIQLRVYLQRALFVDMLQYSEQNDWNEAKEVDRYPLFLFEKIREDDDRTLTDDS